MTGGAVVRAPRMRGIIACMRIFIIAGLAGLSCWGQSTSDPVALGWMAGSPPPADKIIRLADGSAARFPQTRWAFSNQRVLSPTRVVARGNHTECVLPRAQRTDIDGVKFGATTWAESLAANYTDGILILHRGRIVYEKYFGALKPEGQHIAFSVTKSFVATIAASMIWEGLLDEKATVARYVPELKSSGLGDATIREVLDMTTGLEYSEHYDDPRSPFLDYSRAAGYAPMPPGFTGADNIYGYLKTLTKEYPHGEKFDYKTVNTEALAWVMVRATGKSISEILRERLWSRLGMEQDGYFRVDSIGTESAGGGLNLTLRDMARFGEMIRLGGRFNGQQIVPSPVVEDIRRGGDKEKFAKAGYKTLPGWSYRDMWWVSHNSHGAFTARGVYGQCIYIDPKAEMVIVRFASHPMAANVNLDPTSLPAYEAVAELLMGSKWKAPVP